MDRPKVILISANTHKEPYPVYPLGVSYLKTYLERSIPGIGVEILDRNIDSDETIAQKVRGAKPVMVGISLRNADGANSLDQKDFMTAYAQLVELVRQNTDAPVSLGGAAFSMFPYQFMSALGADFGITGEGEESMRQAVENLMAGKPVDGIEGVVTHSGHGLKVNPRSCYLKSLEVDFEERLVDYYWKYSGMLNIQTKRGCPYNCVYCSYPVIDGRKVRTLDAEAVAENIARLKKDKGINYFFFTDSVFNIANDYNAELAEALIRSGAGISWGAYFAPHNITPELMSLWKASGLTHVEFGTESLSDPCLEKYGKMFTVEDVMRASEVCLDNNVFYSHFLILGGYGETAASVEETIENSKRIRHSVFFPFVGMRIYPDTGLHKVAVAEGVIDKEDSLFSQKYYLADDFDLESARKAALETGKAWIFPDDPRNGLMDVMRVNKGRKGPLWEYLRKP